MSRILKPISKVSINVCAVIAFFVIPLSADAQQRLTFTTATEKPHALPPESSASFPAKATTISVPDSDEAFGTPSAISDGSGSIHIIYTDKISDDKVVLRYLRQKGAAWESAEIDRLGSASQDDGRLSRGIRNQIPSPVIDNNGNLHFTFFKVESNKLNLYYAHVNPSQGIVTKALIETITSNSNEQMGLAIDKQNVVHISYYNEGLKYANNKSGGFIPTMLFPNEDTKPNFIERGVNSTMLILPNGNILIPYQGDHHRNWAVVAQFIDCQVYADGNWKNIGIVGSLGMSSTNGFNIFMVDGIPTLVYFSGYAQYNGKWINKKLNWGDFTGSRALSATTASNGKPVMARYSQSGKLFVSYFNGDSWANKSVEDIEQYGNAFPIIVPTANGKVEVFVKANVQGKGAIVRISER